MICFKTLYEGIKKASISQNISPILDISLQYLIEIEKKDNYDN